MVVPVENKYVPLFSVKEIAYPCPKPGTTLENLRKEKMSFKFNI